MSRDYIILLEHLSLYPFISPLSPPSLSLQPAMHFVQPFTTALFSPFLTSQARWHDNKAKWPSRNINSPLYTLKISVSKILWSVVLLFSFMKLHSRLFAAVHLLLKFSLFIKSLFTRVRVVCLIFQWLHPKIYLAWRIFWALYHLGWMTYDVWYDVTNNPHLGTWLIYLTNWTFLWLTACCLLDAVAVCYANFTESSAGNQLWQFLTFLWNIYILRNHVKQGAGRPVII